MRRLVPLIHEAITLNPDPTEFMPIEVNSAFPASAKSNLNAQEKAQVDKLIEAVPDVNDTLAINYMVDMGDKKVYLEGWIDQCLTGTGFPPMGGGDWDDKIEYMVRDAHRILIEKQEESNRPYIGLGHWPLIEGGFREFEAGQKGWLYGVTWGVYEKSKSGGANPMMEHRGTDPEAIKVADRFGLVFDGMMGDLYEFTVAKGPEEARGITFVVKDLSQVETRLAEKLKEFGIPTGFLKGQIIVIKSKAIYGWRAWATVGRDDPEHNQVWVKEMRIAVKYEDIEGEEGGKPMTEVEAAVPEVKLSTRLAEINNRIRQLNAQLATAKMGRPSKATQTIRMRIQEELDKLFVESDELTKQFLAKSKPPVVEGGNPMSKKEPPIHYEARLWRKWANMDDVSRPFATEQEAFDYLTHLKYIAKAGDKITVKRSQEWDIKVLHRETIEKDGQFWAIRKPFEPIPTEPKEGNPAKEPWQMTLEQYAVEKGARPAWVKAGYGETYRFHKTAVERALREGKPVPPEVLADYPDLAARYGPGEIRLGGRMVEIPLDASGRAIPPEEKKEGNPKEPWQMTRDEFSKTYPFKAGADAVHRSAVFGALYQGKPVPPEVLADYPELTVKPSIGSNPMITDVDTALKDIADWYVDTRRGITEPELETILLKHCGSEAEVQKFVSFLETEPGQLRFKTLLRERK